MLLSPPGEVHQLTTVKLVGPIVQWVTALLLVAVFAVLIPLGSQRRAVVTWMIAWVAQVVSMSWVALTSIFILGRPEAPLPFWTSVLQPFYWSARLIFLVAITLGACAAAGKRLTQRWHFGLIGLAGVLGLGISMADVNLLGDRVCLLATILLVFGSVQLVLLRAQGERRRGLIFLACAMTLFGALSAIYLLNNFIGPSYTGLASLVSTVSLSSGYGDAMALGVLAAAAIVVIVQEAFLQAAEAHERRLLGVAASEARLNGIIQAAQEAIITVGLDGRIELINGAAESLFSVSHAAALGRGFDEFVIDAPTVLIGTDAAGLATLADGARSGLVTHAARGRRADGTLFALEFTIGPLRGEGRSGAVVVLHDLTERNAKQAERAAFEHRMAESEKMLAIGRVVSGVAHELNNPLAVVLGQSEQLTDSATVPEMKAGMRLIHEQAHRARHIVRDLLAFVRRPDGGRELVNLSHLAARTIDLQRGAALARGVTLLTELPTGLPLILVDCSTVEQALVNLVDNGIDAAGAGGTVRVSARAVDGHVELVIEDSGAGVADGNVSRIFEPFFSTKGLGRGTGLGLSVSASIVSQQGGTLRLDNNRAAGGIGARFVLSLPVYADGPASAAIVPSSAVFPGPPLRGMGVAAEVMLIDDEASVRSTLSRMFKRAGWQVREAVCGEDGLAWLEGVPEADAPAVILCDLKMPGLSGREVYELLALRRPALAERFVFVTGDVVESVSNGFIAASGRLVVEKPFTVAEIGRAVELTINPH